MKVEFTKKAAKDLDKIMKSNNKIALRIIDAITEYSDDKGTNLDVKPLVAEYYGSYRIRIADYRVLFEINDNKMQVFRIKHRKEAY